MKYSSSIMSVCVRCNVIIFCKPQQIWCQSRNSDLCVIQDGYRQFCDWSTVRFAKLLNIAEFSENFWKTETKFSDFNRKFGTIGWPGTCFGPILLHRLQQVFTDIVLYWESVKGLNMSAVISFDSPVTFENFLAIDKDFGHFSSV